jgi:hypothetical protein
VTTSDDNPSTPQIADHGGFNSNQTLVMILRRTVESPMDHLSGAVWPENCLPDLINGMDNVKLHDRTLLRTK